VVDELKYPPISIVVSSVPGYEVRLATHGAIGTPRITLGRGLEPDDAGRNVALVGELYARNWLGLNVDRLLAEKPEKRNIPAQRREV